MMPFSNGLELRELEKVKSIFKKDGDVLMNRLADATRVKAANLDIRDTLWDPVSDTVYLLNNEQRKCSLVIIRTKISREIYVTVDQMVRDVRRKGFPELVKAFDDLIVTPNLTVFKSDIMFKTLYFYEPAFYASRLLHGETEWLLEMCCLFFYEVRKTMNNSIITKEWRTVC